MLFLSIRKTLCGLKIPPRVYAYLQHCPVIGRLHSFALTPKHNVRALCSLHYELSLQM